MNDYDSKQVAKCIRDVTSRLDQIHTDYRMLVDEHIAKIDALRPAGMDIEELGCWVVALLVCVDRVVGDNTKQILGS